MIAHPRVSIGVPEFDVKPNEQAHKSHSYADFASLSVFNHREDKVFRVRVRERESPMAEICAISYTSLLGGIPQLTVFDEIHDVEVRYEHIGLASLARAAHFSSHATLHLPTRLFALVVNN